MTISRRALRANLLAWVGIVAAWTPREAAPQSAAGFTWRAAREALLRGDLVAAIAAGAGAGPRDYAAALAAEDRVVTTAALVVLEARGQPWALAELAAAVRSPDGRVARGAARAARAIVARLAASGPAGEAAAELDGEALSARSESFAAVARDERRWSDVRSDCLEIAAALGDVAVASGAMARVELEQTLVRMLDDADPALASAAAELLPLPLSAETSAELARRVVAHRDEAIGKTFAAALCAELADGAAAQRILAALGPAGLEVVATSARSAGSVGSEEVELARCLVADGSAASRAALAHLRAVARPALARALRAVERGAR